MANTQSDTADRVRKIIMDQLGLDATKVVDTASFSDDLGADSLEVVQIVMEIEEAFGIEIRDDAADTILTVGDAVNFVLTSQKQPALKD
ncbi:acyl carrier protein [Neorhizobium lilium]|uniref:Acyl carrier protein n=1 Tax=Neorhizobium lilium TaxID=2503024 RepID=A0A3S3S563_9HYPH|nr:acyl carrier protein [Neorhizobium lilium]RWX77074.1 acyl carrier protein [Neorhizobium lilium]